MASLFQIWWAMYLFVRGGEAGGVGGVVALGRGVPQQRVRVRGGGGRVCVQEIRQRKEEAEEAAEEEAEGSDGHLSTKCVRRYGWRIVCRRSDSDTQGWGFRGSG